MKTFLRCCAIACVASLFACSSSSDGGDGAGNDSGTTGDGAGSDTSATVDSAPAADSGGLDATSDGSPPLDTGTDATTPTDTAPAGSAFVRVFDGLDGAEIYVCEDATKAFGGNYNRIGSGGPFASGYVERTVFGSHKVYAQASTAPSCLAATSTDPSYTLSKGNVKTLFVKGITGIGGIVSLNDDVTAPASGKARVRIYDGASSFTSSHALGLDVCASGTAWAKGLAGGAASAYVEVTPGAVALEVRDAATTECTGTVLGTVNVTALANTTHTLFLVDGKGAGAKTHATFCTDATAGVPAASASCNDSSL